MVGEDSNQVFRQMLSIILLSALGKWRNLMVRQVLCLPRTPIILLDEHGRSIVLWTASEGSMLVICLEVRSATRHHLWNRVLHHLGCINAATNCLLTNVVEHVRARNGHLGELLFALVNKLACRCRLNVDLGAAEDAIDHPKL